jgi:hypothetical protein
MPILFFSAQKTKVSKAMGGERVASCRRGGGEEAGDCDPTPKNLRIYFT